MITPIFVRMKQNWKALILSEEQAKIKAERALIENEEKTKFLSLISHESRTPLNAVIGFAEHLGTQLDHSNTEIKVALQGILKNGQDLSVIIDGMIDYSISVGELRPSVDDFMKKIRIQQDKIKTPSIILAQTDDKLLSSDISILAADDNKTNRIIIEKKVKRFGGVLDMVEDGEQGCARMAI